MRVHYVRYRAGDRLAELKAEVTLAEYAIYSLLADLILSRGEPFPNRPEDLARMLLKADLRVVKSAISGLIAKGKVVETSGYLSIISCTSALERAGKSLASARENGNNGGRPPNEINGVAEPGGLFPEKLPTIQEPETKNELSNGAGAPVLRLAGGRSATTKELFDTWYSHYPRKEAPARALKAYEKAIRKPGVNSELLLHAVRRYAAMVTAESKERQFIPHPATWLNDERWRDQAAPPVPGSPRGNGAPPGPGNGGDRGFL